MKELISHFRDLIKARNWKNLKSELLKLSARDIANALAEMAG